MHMVHALLCFSVVSSRLIYPHPLAPILEYVAIIRHVARVAAIGTTIMVFNLQFKSLLFIWLSGTCRFYLPVSDLQLSHGGSATWPIVGTYCDRWAVVLQAAVLRRARWEAPISIQCPPSVTFGKFERTGTSVGKTHTEKGVDSALESPWEREGRWRYPLTLLCLISTICQ